MTEAQVLMTESVSQTALMVSPAQTEAVRAGLEQRAPEFIDP